MQLFAFSKSDVEKVVDVVLQRMENRFPITARSATDNAEEFISQKDAAKLLKISLPTIIKWRREEALPHYQFGDRFMYLKSEIIDYGKIKKMKK